MNLLRWARVHWDRATGGTLVALGGLFVIVGWNRIGGEALTAQQIPYLISGGIGGLFLLGAGATLWLSADLRDEWRKLDAIERHLAERAGVEQPAIADDPFTAPEPATSPTPTARPRRAPLRAGTSAT